ncbi:cutinase family protein [Pseudonocardiaceae bacterium YIM PH 21723]|nr:cutinase family protein [Pseudonocardiaceae bacterium YIM PH 21723]
MSAVLAGLLMATALSVVSETAANAAPCEGTYTIVVGGTNSTWDNDGFVGNIQQHVGYPNLIPNGAAAQAGADELNRLVNIQRQQCPGQHVKMGGYSLGAAAVHIWVTQHGDAFGNVNAVLLADPKRQGGPGASGSTDVWGVVGAPLAGVDRFFGGVPVKSICNWDYICDVSAPIHEYPHAHIVNYDFDRNMDNHNDSAHEQWYNRAWFPW